MLSKEEAQKNVKTDVVKKELTEGEAYKILYENQVKANDAVLKTIFYALGGLGSAMLFVFASNWWFNEKKVAEIKNGITNQITNEVNEISSELKSEINLNISSLNSTFSTFAEKFRIETKEDQINLLKNYQSQLDSFSNNINIQLATTKTSIDERFEVLRKEIALNKVEINKSIKKVKDDIEIATTKIKINTLGNEAFMWLQKEIYLNAFRCYIEQGTLSTEIDYSWNLKYVFRDINKILDKITFVIERDVTKFETFIDSIATDQYTEEKQILVEAFKKIEVKENPKI